MLELFIGIRNMEKESTVGQMEQNLKVILKMTRRKDLGHSVFPVEIYLRFDFHYRFSVKWIFNKINIAICRRKMVFTVL